MKESSCLLSISFLLWTIQEANSAEPSINGIKSKRFKREETYSAGSPYCYRVLRPSDYGYWRKIDFTDFFDTPSTNFQCTWRLETTSDKKIQISIKRLNFGSDGRGTAVSCQGNYVELTDNGFSRGKFCHREVPGDYVAEGSSLQVDVRGDYRLVRILQSETSPFAISYRSIPNSEQSGGRPHSQDIIYEDDLANAEMSSTPFSILKIPKITPGRTFEDELREEGGIGMSVGAIVGIISACLLLLILVIAIVLYRKKKKEEKKNDLNLAETSSGSSYSNKKIPIPEVQAKYYDDLAPRMKRTRTISNSENNRPRIQDYEERYSQLPRHKNAHYEYDNEAAYPPITPPRPRPNGNDYVDVIGAPRNFNGADRQPKKQRTGRKTRGTHPVTIQPMSRTASRNPNHIHHANLPHPGNMPMHHNGGGLPPKMRSTPKQIYRGR